MLIKIGPWRINSDNLSVYYVDVDMDSIAIEFRMVDGWIIRHKYTMDGERWDEAAHAAAAALDDAFICNERVIDLNKDI